MPDLPITERLIIPAAELEVSFARSSGPGGQNVNKVATKVELRWNLAESAILAEADRAWLMVQLASRLTSAGELVVTSDRTRFQARNRDDATAKLVEIIRTALVRPRKRKPTRAGRGAIERRLRAKKSTARKKQQRRPPDDS